MKTIISIAIGDFYRIEAHRLLHTISDLKIITTSHPDYSVISEDESVNRNLVKTSFAKFLPENEEGEVILCDSGLCVVNGENPFTSFPQLKNTDIAAVAYPGRFFFPESQSSHKDNYIKLGGKINTNLLWFKDFETAKKVSKAWVENFIANDNSNIEFALMSAIVNGDWKLTWLDKKWNNFETPHADDILRYQRATPEEIEILKSHMEIEVEPTVPGIISAWQAKAALALTANPQGGDMLTAAELIISNMPDGVDKIVIQSAWNNNANFDRNSRTIILFGELLGMTPTDVDNVFRLGASLTV